MTPRLSQNKELLVVLSSKSVSVPTGWRFGVEIAAGVWEVSAREGAWLTQTVRVFRRWATNFSAQPSAKISLHILTLSPKEEKPFELVPFLSNSC